MSDQGMSGHMKVGHSGSLKIYIIIAPNKNSVQQNGSVDPLQAGERV
jgi:hypothetical protein